MGAWHNVLVLCVHGMLWAVTSAGGGAYTSQWAARIHGGREMAEEVAGRHGFHVHAEVSQIEHCYLDYLLFFVFIFILPACSFEHIQIFISTFGRIRFCRFDPGPGQKYLERKISFSWLSQLSFLPTIFFFGDIPIMPVSKEERKTKINR